jgi:hypothetical protein
MRMRGIRRVVIGLVLVVASACVAEPGSSGLPAETTRPEPIVTPSPVPATPSPQPVDSSPVPTGVAPTPAAAPSPATGSTVVDLSGDGTLRSGPFSVDEDWVIAWQRTGTRLFSVQLVPADVDVFGELVVSATGPASGSSPMHEAGTFLVQVFASEPWTIRIVDVLPVPARPIPAAAAGTGRANTEIFAADGPLLIEWAADRAAPLGIELVTMTTGEPLLIAAERHAEVSCRSVAVADEFYLHVVTDAGWTITLRPSEGEAVCPAD